MGQDARVNSAPGSPPQTRPATPPPPEGSVERWCWDLVTTRDLARKLAPPAPPDVRDDRAWEHAPPARRVDAPGRPPELRVAARSPRTPRPGALNRPAVRGQLLHTFVHHELQAAELFAWAVLAFPATPRSFRRGLFALCRDELEHLALYARHMESLGVRFGDHPVRDWFWDRVGSCADPVAFLALQGLGLEGANLEHSARFAAGFRAAGDEAGARILDRVQAEEVAHVAFAVRWFAELTGAPLDYARWKAALPAPLTPALLQGRPLNRAARTRAGLDEEFLRQLAGEPSTRHRRTP